MGLSTFGISSLTGSNNPFQIIAFVGSNIINQGISGQTDQGSDTATVVSANAEPGSPPPRFRVAG